MYLPSLILALLLAIPSEAGLIFRRAPQGRVLARQNSVASGFHNSSLLSSKSSTSATPAGASPTTEVFFEYTIDAPGSATLSTTTASSKAPTTATIVTTATKSSSSSSTSTLVGAQSPSFSRSLHLGNIGPSLQPQNATAAQSTTLISSAPTAVAGTSIATSLALTSPSTAVQITSAAQVIPDIAIPITGSSATTRTGRFTNSPPAFANNSSTATPSSTSLTLTFSVQTTTVYVTLQPSTGPAISLSSSTEFDSTVTVVVTKPTITVTLTPTNSASVGTSQSVSSPPSSPTSTTTLRQNTDVPTGTPNTRVPTAILALPAATATVSPNEYRKNVGLAKNSNELFKLLDMKSACTPGQIACIGGDMYVCDEIGFEVRENCGNRQLGCFAVPMNTTVGVMVGCYEPSFADSVLGGAAGRPPSFSSSAASSSTPVSSSSSTVNTSTRTSIPPPPPPPSSNTKTHIPTRTPSPGPQTTSTISSSPPPSPSTTEKPVTSETPTFTTSTYSKTHTAEFIEVTVISHHRPKTTAN